MCRLVLLLRWQLWNLDDGIPLTPRVASAATFEHLIKDDSRADAPSVLPEPWGYTRRREDPNQPEGSPVSAASQLMDNLDYLDSIPDWKDEHE